MKEKHKIAVLLSLVVLAVAVWMPPLVHRFHVHNAVSDVSLERELTPPVVRSVPDERPRSAFTGWGVNPFAWRRVVKAEQPRGLSLSGIAFDDAGSYAIIDEQILHAGDTLPNGVVVVAVESRRVILRHPDGKEEILAL